MHTERRAVYRGEVDQIPVRKRIVAGGTDELLVSNDQVVAVVVEVVPADVLHDELPHFAAPQ